MGGLVLGLDVKPSARAQATAVASARAPERVLDLYAGARPRTFGERPGYGFVLREGPRAPAADSIRIPGTPLVLTRGEPVRIAVHNRLAFPIAVHWHGIELESYFDGVGGFSGAGRRIAPMIAPNDSFVVRFTPPRAGTYMYHVHGEQGEELASGLYAPLLVLEPGASFDPRTDRVFVLADGGPGDAPPVFVNGTATPDTLELVAGTTYRLRLCYITANDVIMTTLRGPGGPVPARLIAFDGHDLPSGVLVSRPLRQPTGPGHTLDFAFTPGALGDYALVFDRLAKGAGPGVTVGQATTVPIRVRAP
jgi:FtsP/CotA-like multicopper oxidase with cupredoxin domain